MSVLVAVREGAKMADRKDHSTPRRKSIDPGELSFKIAGRKAIVAAVMGVLPTPVKRAVQADRNASLLNRFYGFNKLPPGCDSGFRAASLRNRGTVRPTLIQFPDRS
jgi:hypothetical protein